MSPKRVLVVAAAAILSVTATAAEQAREETRPAARIDVRALFERAPGVITSTPNGDTVEPHTVEIILARIGPDGELIKVCVDSEEAARRFLDAPIDTLRTKQAREK